MLEPYYVDDMVTLLHGDALEMARTVPTGSVQTIVTSPPYFGLRDYGEVGQMGAEDTLDGYVAGMVALFAELRRTLADDGTLWLNLGDSYGSCGGDTHTGFNSRYFDSEYKSDDKQTKVAESARAAGAIKRARSMPAKNLLGVPWRTALALQSDGWILRSDIIWAKPNPMPESVTDRPTKSHEYLFLLAKSPRYYYDADAIAETVTDSTLARVGQNVEAQTGSTRANGGAKTNGNMKAIGPKFGGTKYGDSDAVESRTKSGNVYIGQATRNRRTVWTVPTLPFSGAHFAVYPPELIRPCILAGSRIGDTVLDPFSGSGTTGMVATQEGRKYVGIDLNSDYLNLSLRTRFAQPTLNLGEIA